MVNKMGVVQSNTVKQAYSELNHFITNNVNTIVDKATLNCIAGNEVKLNFGNSGACVFVMEKGVVNVNNTAVSTCSLSSENITDIQESVKNSIKTLLEQFVKQGSQSTQDFLATAVSIQIQNATTTDEIINQIETSIKNNVSNFCDANVASTNRADITVCGQFSETTLNILNDAFVAGVASCVNKNITQAFIENDTLNKLVQEADQKLAAEQKGLGGFLQWLIIGLVIVGAILILVMLGYLFIKGQSGKKQGSSTVNIVAGSPQLTKNGKTPN